MSDGNEIKATVLVHLNNAAENMQAAMREFAEGKIDAKEFEDKLNAASPSFESVGCEIDAEAEKSKVNTKPIPENAEAAVYFYKEEDGTLRMTVRLLNYGDNETLVGGDEASIAEIAPLELLRLINMEHQSVLQGFMLSVMAAKAHEEQEDDDLSEIEDEETRNQVRKFLKH